MLTVCRHCNELIAADDMVDEETFMHIECAVRRALGSAAHQLKRCGCYGGDEEEAGMTRREAARAAFKASRRQWN